MAFFFNINFHELPTNYPLMINYMGHLDMSAFYERTCFERNLKQFFIFSGFIFCEIEKRMYLCSSKKVFSGRGNRLSGRRNRIYGAEIEFLAREKTFVVKT